VKAAIVIAALLLFGLYQLGSAPESTPAMTGGWETDLLRAIGNTQPTSDTITYLAAWYRAEGGTAAFNPLNTTQIAPGATCYNADPCVKNYPDYATGIQATAETLLNGSYPLTLAGLQKNAPIVDDAEMAIWGTGGGAIRRQLATAPQAAPQAASDARAQIVARALAQVGKGYVLGTQGPDTFDCSGLIQWVYAQQGIDTGRTTFDQLPRLRQVAPDQIEAGDMVYFQFSWDQHTGILADVDGDGRWDMINAGTPQIGVVVTHDVFGDPFWTNAIIGYRSAL
jgi:cell wall-associated NlpC family hydrolase